MQLKKLRLTKLPVTSSQTKFEDFQLELSGKSSQDVLQILMDFSKSAILFTFVICGSCFMS